MNYKNLGMFLIILFGFVLNVISMQVVGSSIRNLQGALNIGLDQVSYVMSAYLMAEVVIIPFAGWLSRLLSIRLLFLIALSGFLVACIGAASTSNFYILVGFRVMQGFFGGALMPLMFSCIYYNDLSSHQSKVGTPSTFLRPLTLPSSSAQCFLALSLSTFFYSLCISNPLLFSSIS